MGLYNAATWLARREMHLAVNTVLYTALTVWEQKHVAHHVAAMRTVHEPANGVATESAAEPAAEGAAPAVTTLAA
jgi:hypothetical protein